MAERFPRESFMGLVVLQVCRLPDGGQQKGMTRDDILHYLESDVNDNNGDSCFGVIRGTCRVSRRFDTN